LFRIKLRQSLHRQLTLAFARRTRLDKDIDLVADNKLAIEHHVELRPKSFRLMRPLGTVAMRWPIMGSLNSHTSPPSVSPAGCCLDSEVAGHGVAIVSGLFDPGAFEGDRRIRVDFQKFDERSHCPVLVVVRILASAW